MNCFQSSVIMKGVLILTVAVSLIRVIGKLDNL